jgi:hypothetical protein
MRKFSKWGSVNTDSGISLFSSDTMNFKNRDSMSISGSSSSSVTLTKNMPLYTQMLPPEVIPTAAHNKMLEDVRRFVGDLLCNVLKILIENFLLQQIETISTATTSSTKKCCSTAIARQKLLATRPSRSARRRVNRTRANNHRCVFILR